MREEILELIERVNLNEKIYAPLCLKQRGFSAENPLYIEMRWTQPIKASMIRDLNTGKVADMKDSDYDMMKEKPGIFIRYNYQGRVDLVDMAADALYRIRRYVKDFLELTTPLVSDRYSSEDFIQKVVGPSFRRASTAHQDDYVTVSEGEIQRLTFRELIFGYWVFCPIQTIITPKGYIDAKHLAATLEDA